MYAFVARFFGWILDVFYRRRHLGGALPTSGPTLLVANHPNGLIDAVLIMRVAGRPVRFLAKAPLFDVPVVGRLTRWVRALPVYRKQDGHDTRANADVFRAVHEALAGGDLVCLFPEGVSHNEPSLQPLKTGAARMALGAEASSDHLLGVQIVPFGIHYRDKGVFRTELAVQVGEPIVLDEAWRAKHTADPREAARELTEQIADAIRAVTVNTESWDDLRLFEFASRIWVDANDPIVRLRTMADAVRDLADVVTPARIAELRARLEAFAQDLDALGLEPEALERPVQPERSTRFVIRNLLVGLLGLPVAALGVATYVVPYQAVRLLVGAIDPEADLVATVKVLASVLLFGIWQIALYIALVVWCGWLLGTALAIALPVAALYGLGFIERRVAAVHRARMTWRLIRSGEVGSTLRAERAALRAEIEALATLYARAEPSGDAPLSRAP